MTPLAESEIRAALSELAEDLGRRQLNWLNAVIEESQRDHRARG